MKLLSAAVIAVLSIGLSGCASVINGESQTVEIISTPATGADCTLTSSRGTWKVATPGKVEILRSKDNVTINCHKDGWQDAMGVMRPHMDSTALATAVILTGGIGLGVDAASGAVNEYPKMFDVPMKLAQPAQPAPAAAAAAAPAAPATAAPASAAPTPDAAAKPATGA